jgi:acyl-coenzyme A thioesterase PaaI-like protein
MSGKDDSARIEVDRRRLAEAMRELCAEVVACDAPDSVFREAAEAVEAFVEQLRAEPRRVRTVSSSLEEEIRTEGNRYHYGDLLDFSPLAGLANPLAPPMSVSKEDDATLAATLTFSAAFEGGPGLTHGGYVAAAFDELLGLTQSLTGEAGVTAKLKVRYRSPCPLNTELRMEGKVHKIEGRRIVAKGTMHADERLVADGEATFIVLDEEVYRDTVSRFGGKK